MPARRRNHSPYGAEPGASGMRRQAAFLAPRPVPQAGRGEPTCARGPRWRFGRSLFSFEKIEIVLPKCPAGLAPGAPRARRSQRVDTMRRWPLIRAFMPVFDGLWRRAHAKSLGGLSCAAWARRTWRGTSIEILRPPLPTLLRCSALGWSEGDLQTAIVPAPWRRNSPAKTEPLVANTMNLQWPENFGDNAPRTTANNNEHQYREQFRECRRGGPCGRPVPSTRARAPAGRPNRAACIKQKPGAVFAAGRSSSVSISQIL
jgi:hypothetical protein